MKKTKITVLRCSLCGADHRGEERQAGWFARYKTDKMRKIEDLICPNCLLERWGIRLN